MRACVLPLLLVLTGCGAHYPLNRPLAAGTAPPLALAAGAQTSADTLFVLTFSGGGTRAAALAYGVLEELTATTIGPPQKTRRLLDEVDLISAVSGGSFTAAYYGVYGERIFADYNRAFLKRDVQGALTARLLWPSNWPRLFSSYYARSDLAAEYLDETLFHGATLGDMDRRGGPEVQINATDLTQASYFSFSPQQFGWLCSDYRDFPVARAVVASSAVPLVASTVLLHNYADRCAQKPATARASKAGLPPPEREREQVLASYRDTARRPYIHLLDGGLVDNLGLRAALDRLARNGGPARRPGLGEARRLAFIVVNAETGPDESLDQSDRPLGLGEALRSASDVPVVRYNLESTRLLNHWLARLKREREQLCAARTGQCKRLETYVAEVKFAAVPDAQRRARLRRVPTRLGLPSATVRELRRTAREVLRAAPDYQRLVRDLRQ